MSASVQNRQHDVEAAAAFWLVRLGSEACAPEDRAAFEAWRRADPAHQAAYDRMRRGAGFVDRHVADADLQALAETARRETAPRWHQQNRWRAGIAACLALLVIAPALLVWRSTPQAEPLMAQTIPVERYETALGERSTVTLADASIVTLNTDSRIEVDFTAGERRVRLMRGQALFEVERDADRPFVVEASDQRIMALGTAFDVRLDADAGVQVTLLEGRVAIDAVPAPQPAPRLAPGRAPAPAASREAATVELQPGEQFLSSAPEAHRVRPTQVSDVTSWRTGRLVFRERPLAEAIAEMNRYSAQKLVVDDDERLQAMTVSGVFNTGRVSNFVTTLETMHPAQAERTGAQELTLVWRD